MYVRWKKRMRSRRHRPTGEHMLTAILVESRRVDGKPRQHILAYLGTISERYTAAYYHQLDFWTSANLHIDSLNLDSETVTRLRSTLERIVPVPTPQSQAEAAKHLAVLTNQGRQV